MPKRINCNSCSNSSPISQIENNVCLACRVVDEYLTAENANLSNKKPKLTAEEPIFAPNTSQYDAFTQYANYDHDNITFDNIQLTRQEERLKNHACKECGKAFTEKYNLNSHIKQKHTEPQLPCQKCEKKFHFPYLRDNHYKIKHLNQNMFQCPIPDCFLSFGLKGNLKAHINIIHNNMTRFNCQFCEYKCYDKYRITKHTNMHLRSAETHPHKCDTCGLGFKNRSNLSTHIKSNCNPKTN
jgi:Zinc finger, C2H2 type